MNIRRRNFLRGAGALTAGATLTACSYQAHLTPAPTLATITGDVSEIGVAERIQRIDKARQLMTEHDLQAIVLEPGAAMSYFSGVNWWRSERLTAVIIPASGDIAVVTPFFEEPSVRESLQVGDDVRTWHEHDSPFKRVADILQDRGIKSGRIGLEATVRHFVADGLQQQLPGYQMVSADVVTQGCRMYKSVAELRLMHKASEVTLRAYEHVIPQVEAGMNGTQIKALMNEAQTRLGGSSAWSLVLVGPASAYPHGTGQQQDIAPGDVVLMDCGSSVHGYQSDISRTFVVGEASAQQRKVWQQVRRGQQIAFETAQINTHAGAVDDAVRSWYEQIGYGPGYATPGLSHRTGHGIGMEGHEPVNFVHGEMTQLAPGMCFSNEPGIYDFDTFGVRLEDCLYMTDNGPVWFTIPPDDIDTPLGRLGPLP